MRRSTLALLALCVINSIGFAQNTNISGDGLWLYTVNGSNEAKLVGITQIASDEFQRYEYLAGFEVPAVVDGYPLTTIGPNAFTRLVGGNGSWDTIALYGVTRVEADAFNGVTVRNLEFWSDTLSIEDAAFRSCRRLQNISASDVTKIGARAFFECYDFSGFTDFWTGEKRPIPSTVRSIGEWAFFDCPLPPEVTIPSGITSIQGNTFFSSDVNRLIIPDTVTSIAYDAFGGGNIRSLLFKGSPPAGPFSLAGTIYRLPGASGWSNNFGGVPVEIFLGSATATGMSPASGFQFSWSGSGPFAVNVERATSPGGSWTVVSSNNTNGEFTDLDPPSRRAFYRAQAAIP